MSGLASALPTDTPARQDWPLWQRNYTIGILCLVGFFNYVDRQLLSILVEPIKAELQISDTAIGLLTGIAFSAFYVIAGIPLARLADRGNRRTLIAACLTVWSLATALCGFAQNYIHLALARIGVAGGEAGSAPAIQSLIIDLFPASRRATMLGIFQAAMGVGIGAGYFLGGWLNTAFDWRTAFVVVSLPGVLLAVIMMLTVREPPRGLSDPDGDQKSHGESHTLREVFAFILGNIPLRFLVMIAVTSALAGYSILNWGPAYMMRSFGWTTMQVGSWMGPATAFGLIFGNVAAGLIGDRIAKGDLVKYMLVAGFGTALAYPFIMLFALAPTPHLAIFGLFVGKMLMTFWLPPTLAVALTMSPPRMRAMVAAVIALCMSLIGAGFGPTIAGIVSDLLTPVYGPDGLRYSIAIMASLLLVCAALCFVAARVCRTYVAGKKI